MHVRDQLGQLETVVHTILLQAMEAGKVFIITNASEGWVQHSAGMCMPGLMEPLQKIEVISARAGFENAFPGDSHAWKMHSFLQACCTLGSVFILTARSPCTPSRVSRLLPPRPSSMLRLGRRVLRARIRAPRHTITAAARASDWRRCRTSCSSKR